MIKKFCDKCNSEDNVKIYNNNNTCIRETYYSWYIKHDDGITLHIPNLQAYCAECFVTLDNKVRAVIKEVLSL